MNEPLVALTDELFTCSPDEFTAKRDVLVKSLKAEKRKEDAAQVGALRRPTAVLWAMNQIAREDSALVNALADAGEVAIGAQEAVMTGTPMSVLTNAVEDRRVIIGHLINSIVDRVAATGQAAPESMVVPLRHALEVASIDTEIMATFLAGRLTAVPTTADERNAPKPKQRSKSHLSLVVDDDPEVPGMATSTVEVERAEVQAPPADPTAEEERTTEETQEAREGAEQQVNALAANVRAEQAANERAAEEKAEQKRASEEAEMLAQALEKQAVEKQAQAKAAEQARVAEEARVAEDEKQRVADAAKQLRAHFAKAVADARAVVDNAQREEAQHTARKIDLQQQQQKLRASIDELTKSLANIEQQLDTNERALAESMAARQHHEQALVAAEANAAAAELAMPGSPG